MDNLKRWSICAVLFFICFLILRSLGSNKPIMEGFGRGMGHGYGRGYLFSSPLYIYDDVDYDFRPPYLRRYIPVVSYY
jgi:hypothetical protein